MRSEDKENLVCGMGLGCLGTPDDNSRGSLREEDCLHYLPIFLKEFLDLGFFNLTRGK
jgi:hypothetical protein